MSVCQVAQTAYAQLQLRNPEAWSQTFLKHPKNSRIACSQAGYRIAVQLQPAIP